MQESARELAHAALRLDPEKLYFEETDVSFAIGWKGNYQIDGDAFVFIDSWLDRKISNNFG